VLPSSFPTPSPRISTQLVTSPPWLRTSAVDARLALSRTVHNIVQSARGRGADSDEVRDRIWQLQLLFDWLDRSHGDEHDTASHQQSQSQTPVSGLWLRKDFVEEARWQVWGVQVEDQGVNAGS
jgi:anaphase-promoting complex subunit 1